MPIQPLEMRAMIRDHHVYDFTRRELAVGALIAWGQTDDDIAARLGIRTPTVRRHKAELQRRIFDGLSIAATRTRTAMFIGDHLDCCTRACCEMIENDQFS